MKYDLIVRPEAEAELAEAFNWYEQQVAGLGSRFLLLVDTAINSIQRPEGLTDLRLIRDRQEGIGTWNQSKT